MLCGPCNCFKVEWSRYLHHLLVVAVWLHLVLAHVVNDHVLNDFVSTNILADGEVETRLVYRGITAKETSVGGGKKGVKLRQLSDGHHFIQLIYDDLDEVRDCEFLHQKNYVQNFIHTFHKEVGDLVATSNFTMDSLDDRPLPEYARWLDFEKLRDMCKQRHRAIKRALRQEEHRQNSTDMDHLRQRSKQSPLSNFMILPGTLWCGHSTMAKHYKHLGGLDGTDKCCRKHDYCRKIIPGFSSKFGLVNTKPFTLSHCLCDQRHKRDLSDLLRIPGTKWCGKGRSATKYTHLGGFSRTDKCCRRHDSACPFYISGLQTKYGLFNWRVNTLMHCNCDERFRACLKLSDTSDANLVGKLFFNVVQTKCFVLKPKKTCVKRSWWGKCLKKKYKKQAILRNNVPY